MSTRNMTIDIDPNMNLGLARILYDGFNEGFDNDIIIDYGNKLVLKDSGDNDVEIYVSGTTLTLPATSATTTVDSVAWGFGSDTDVTFTFDGTKFTILCPVTDDTEIEWGDGTNSFDQEFFFASANDTIYFNASDNTVTFNGVDLYLDDADELCFGDDQDVVMRWDAADFDILPAADDSVLKFGNGTESWDIWIYGETADDNIIFSANGKTLSLDGIDLLLEDDDILSFGNSKDVAITWAAGGGLNVTCVGDNTVWTWGATGNSFDMIWYGDSSAKFIKIDTSENTIQYDDIDIYMGDNDNISFGDSQDVVFQYTTKFVISADADDEVIEVGDGTKSLDLKWFFETTSNYVYFDADSDVVIFEAVDLILMDDDVLKFGDGSDVTIAWALAGGLNVLCAADNTVWTWGATGNSFDMIWNLLDTAHFIKIDASENQFIFDDVDIYLGDNDNISFGDSQDVVIQYTTKFTITAAADDEVIEIGNGTESFDIKWFAETAADLIEFNASGKTVTFDGVDLYLDDADELCFGDDQDVTISFEAGGNLVFAAGTDDLVIEIGDSGATQKSFDVIIYGETANGADYFKFDAGESALTQGGAAEMRIGRMTNALVTAKTGDYTVVAADSGTVFHTTGAGAAVNFTLPTLGAGLNYVFVNTVDQNMTITSAAGNDIIWRNDAQASSLAYSSAGEKIGGAFQVWCDGTKWFVMAQAGGTGAEFTISAT